jgi:alpha-N-acetylglucosamine transferase
MLVFVGMELVFLLAVLVVLVTSVLVLHLTLQQSVLLLLVFEESGSVSLHYHRFIVVIVDSKEFLLIEKTT